MRHLYHTLLLTLLTVILASCEKEANIPLPNQDPKLVVSCFISPTDSLIQAAITLSTPLYRYDPGAGNPQYVTNATVLIRDGALSGQLQYNSNLNAFVLDTMQFKIRNGHTYQLQVSAPGGYYAEASCTVPYHQAPPVRLLVADSTSATNRSSAYYRYLVGFNELAGLGHYYRIAVSLFTAFPLGSYHMAEAQSSNRFIDDGSLLLSDEGLDGTEIQARFTTFQAGSIADSVFMCNELCDYNYYQFHKTYNTAKQVGDNPFGEPTLVYSNVKGGLGCFGAYTATYSKVKR